MKDFKDRDVDYIEDDYMCLNPAMDISFLIRYTIINMVFALLCLSSVNKSTKRLNYELMTEKSRYMDNVLK